MVRVRILFFLLCLTFFLSACSTNNNFLCGNGVCDTNEDNTCPGDCVTKEIIELELVIPIEEVIVQEVQEEVIVKWIPPDDVLIEIISKATKFEGNTIYQLTRGNNTRETPRVFDHYVVYVECDGRNVYCNYEDRLVLYDLIKRETFILSVPFDGWSANIEDIFIGEEGIIWTQYNRKKSGSVHDEFFSNWQVWFYNFKSEDSQLIDERFDLGLQDNIKTPTIINNMLYWAVLKNNYEVAQNNILTFFSYDLASDTKSELKTFSDNYYWTLFDKETSTYMFSVGVSENDEFDDYSLIFMGIENLTVSEMLFKKSSLRLFNENFIIFSPHLGQLDYGPLEFLTRNEGESSLFTPDFSISSKGMMVQDNIIVFDQMRDSNSYFDGNYDIFLRDYVLGEGKQITSHPASQMFPWLDGNVMVWLDNRNSYFDVFLYVLENDSFLNVDAVFDDSIFGDYSTLVNLEGLLYDASTDVDFKHVGTFDFIKDICFSSNKIFYGDMNLYVEFAIEEPFCTKNEVTILFSHVNNHTFVRLVESDDDLIVDEFSSVFVGDCRPDCTIGDGICHLDCQGHNGCEPSDSVAAGLTELNSPLRICDGKELFEIIPDHEVKCRNGVMLIGHRCVSCWNINTAGYSCPDNCTVSPYCDGCPDRYGLPYHCSDKYFNCGEEVLDCGGSCDSC